MDGLWVGHLIPCWHVGALGMLQGAAKGRELVELDVVQHISLAVCRQAGEHSRRKVRRAQQLCTDSCCVWLVVRCGVGEGGWGAVVPGEGLGTAAKLLLWREGRGDAPKQMADSSTAHAGPAVPASREKLQGRRQCQLLQQAHWEHRTLHCAGSAP